MSLFFFFGFNFESVFAFLLCFLLFCEGVFDLFNILIESVIFFDILFLFLCFLCSGDILIACFNSILNVLVFLYLFFNSFDEIVLYIFPFFDLFDSVFIYDELSFFVSSELSVIFILLSCFSFFGFIYLFPFLSIIYKSLIFLLLLLELLIFPTLLLFLLFFLLALLALFFLFLVHFVLVLYFFLH